MAFCQNVRMPNEYPLALRQADQARTDFALIEEHLEFNRRPARAGADARVPAPNPPPLATASIWAFVGGVADPVTAISPPITGAPPSAPCRYPRLPHLRADKPIAPIEHGDAYAVTLCESRAGSGSI